MTCKIPRAIRISARSLPFPGRQVFHDVLPDISFNLPEAEVYTDLEGTSQALVVRWAQAVELVVSVYTLFVLIQQRQPGWSYLSTMRWLRTPDKGH